MQRPLLAILDGEFTVLENHMGYRIKAQKGIPAPFLAAFNALKQKIPVADARDPAQKGDGCCDVRIDFPADRNQMIILGQPPDLGEIRRCSVALALVPNDEGVRNNNHRLCRCD